ncbi:MAG: FecR domain-containing protein [Gammaproteobacteria bacterium]
MREQAAQWLTLMHDAAVDDAQRSQFERWLASDASHAREYAALESLWRRLDGAQTWNDLADGLARKRISRRQALKRGAGMLLLASAGLGSAGYMYWRDATLLQLARRSDIGKTLRFAAADGSTVVLGAASETLLRYSHTRRNVSLQQGEAIFDVARDADRPFVVQAGAVRVTVLGTRFAVSRLVDRVRVSVEHGQVRIETGSFWRRQGLMLGAGQVAELTAVPNEPARLEKTRADVTAAFAFEHGFIDLQGADLAELASIFSRYRSMPVRVAGGRNGVADPRVTASVNATDVEGFLLHALSRMAPIRVTRAPDGTILLAPA